jgi:hypothetical protein
MTMGYYVVRQEHPEIELWRSCRPDNPVIKKTRKKDMKINETLERLGMNDEKGRIIKVNKSVSGCWSSAPSPRVEHLNRRQWP